MVLDAAICTTAAQPPQPSFALPGPPMAIPLCTTHHLPATLNPPGVRSLDEAGQLPDNDSHVPIGAVGPPGAVYRWANADIDAFACPLGRGLTCRVPHFVRPEAVRFA